ncbi:HD domain-containing protein [Burkholderia cepacia]|uniref:HD domain-containing protein n=1 Tax=Burkholderia cepacia TaxID=292 RepID=UPI002ABE51FA|nr:HD domain-containing protein [Burkholderia cepacia]
MTQLEADIISTPTFQRLHNVRQLGLAHLVFPGANYSRFAHSVGACHNAGRILDAIERNTGQSFSAEHHQACRLAGLLHDIGHYPFSHATEHIIKSVYSNSFFAEDVGVAPEMKLPEGKTLPPYLDHENVGRQVIDYDPHLLTVFKKHNWEAEAIKRIFSKEEPDNGFFVQVISSDLDCDRLDYLRRTAYMSGLPYGTVDIDYLIDQATLSSDGFYCFSSKALRAADHLLVSRYYDYMQVPFHKTVVALEWSLTTCIRELILRGYIGCSSGHVIQLIESGEWAYFDDNRFFAMFHQLRESLDTGKAEDQLIAAHLEALLMRKPAKLVYSYEIVEEMDASQHPSRVASANSAVKDVARKLGIAEDFLHVWNTPLPLTKAGSKFHEPEAGGAVHVLWDGKKKPLMAFPQALMNTLSKYQFSGVRIFLIDHEDRLGDVKESFAQILPSSVDILADSEGEIDATMPTTATTATTDDAVESEAPFPNQ